MGMNSPFLQKQTKGTKRFGTVCSGIGAPEVAWARLGWRPVFGSEIEDFPNRVREFHFPGVPNLGDMTRFHEWPKRCQCKEEGRMQNEEIKCKRCGGIGIDVLCGGTPCQSFSVAGLRAGLADPRGNLALVFLAIVERYAPRWVLWENVPGVLSSWSDAANRGATEACGRIAGEVGRALRELGFDDGTIGTLGEFEEVDQANDFECFRSGLEELRYGTAWGILDSQYFGVAQRRRRVFVVGHAGGEWQRAAAVLFDGESLCGNPAPRREKGEGIAPTISARVKGGGGLGTDFDLDGGLVNAQCRVPNEDLGKEAIGFNGDVTVKTGINITPTMRREQGGEGYCVAHALKAEGFDASEDGTGRGTPLVPEVSPPLRVGENKTGGQRFQGTDVDGCESLVPEICSAVTSKWVKSSGGPSGDECQNLVAEGKAEAVAFRAAGQDGFDAAPVCPPITSTDGGGAGVPTIAFDTTQITSKENKSNPKPGDPCHTLGKRTHPPAIAFSVKDSGGDAGEVSPTLRSGNHTESHANGGVMPAIAIQEIGKRQSGTPQNGVGYAEPGEPMFTLQSGAQHGVCCANKSDSSCDESAEDGASWQQLPTMAVRRLTPRECERLQGFPDDFTLVDFNGKPAADGNRYRALGNSMAVPVIEWIGKRMDMVDEVLPFSQKETKNA